MRHGAWVVVALAVSCAGGCAAEVSVDGDPATPEPPRPVQLASDATAEQVSAVPPPRSLLTSVEDAALDPRARRGAPRATSLLVLELGQLRVLLQASPYSAPDHPALLRRVADDYVELAQAFRRKAAIGDATDARSRTIAQLRAQQEQLARQGAIASYSAVVTTLRARRETGPDLDSAEYYLALEKARIGDRDGAVRAAVAIVARTPASAWATRAHTLLGAILHERGGAPKGEATDTETVPATSASPPPPPPAAAEPKPAASPACETAFDCPGAETCRAGTCIDQLAR